MSPTEALADALDEVICATKDDAEELLEALEQRGYTVARLPEENWDQ